MIKVYEYLSTTDFIDKFRGLHNTAWTDEWQALSVLFDCLESIDESHEEMNVRDWLRFQVMEMTAEEIEENYAIDFEQFPEVEDFLEYHTAIYGTYEHDGITYYLFSEF